MSTADERLRQFLREGQAWEKKLTNIPGIFLIKLPTFKGTSPSLAMEVNPVNPTGSATKRRGVIIRSNAELEEISRLLSDPKVAQLAKRIDEVNPAKESAAAKSGATDIFEI
jgi:glycerophosphoryl diester phosphodiesterase